MLRFFLTVLFTAIATFCWIVFNPADSARNFLDTAGLLETLQETYLTAEIDPVEIDMDVDRNSKADTKDPALPAESDRAISPAQAPTPGAAPASSPPASSAVPVQAATPRQESFTARGFDYDGSIASLKKDNEDLKHRIEVLRIKRTGSNIQSSEAQRMEERIAANNARIKELEFQRDRAKSR